MAFEPVAYYVLACALHDEANKSSSEAKRRVVVSRAYYGAFLEAREKAGISNKSRDVHQQVISYFKNNPLPNAAVSNWLNDLRDLRNSADYDLNVPCTARNSGNALKQAEKVLRYLGALPLPTNPATVMTQA